MSASKCCECGRVFGANESCLARTGGGFSHVACSTSAPPLWERKSCSDIDDDSDAVVENWSARWTARARTPPISWSINGIDFQFTNEDHGSIFSDVVVNDALPAHAAGRARSFIGESNRYSNSLLVMISNVDLYYFDAGAFSWLWVRRLA